MLQICERSWKRQNRWFVRNEDPEKESCCWEETSSARHRWEGHLGRGWQRLDSQTLLLIPSRLHSNRLRVFFHVFILKLIQINLMAKRIMHFRIKTICTLWWSTSLVVTLCQCSLRRADSRRVWQGKIYRKVIYILHIRAGQIFFGQKLQTRQGNLGQKFSALQFWAQSGHILSCYKSSKVGNCKALQAKIADFKAFVT